MDAIAGKPAPTVLCSQIFLSRRFDEFFQSKSGGCARVYQLPFSQMNINVRIPIRKDREASR
jgi:hypothetical protein